MDEIISTANRALAAFFATWVNPAAFVLMLGVTARVWIQSRKSRERERANWSQGYSWGYKRGYDDALDGRGRRES